MKQSHTSCIRNFKYGAASLRTSISASPVEISVGSLHQCGIWSDRVVAERLAVEGINLGEVACDRKFKKCACIGQTALLGGAIESAVGSQNQGVGKSTVSGACAAAE